MAITIDGSNNTITGISNTIEEDDLKVSNAGSNGQFLQKSANTGGLTWATVDTSIADDSITEAKLDIHAAPSGTDKYLKYTSNGMEWATVSSPILSITGQTNWTAITDGATTVDITGIASGAKRLEMYFKGLSHGNTANNGNQNVIWTLGDSGGFETSGYTNTGWFTGPSNTASGADQSDGFQFMGPSAAGYIMRGVMRLYKMDDSDHEWYCEAFSAASTGGYRFGFNGLKTLSGELTQIQIGWTGSDNFDAGGEYKLYTWT